MKANDPDLHFGDLLVKIDDKQVYCLVGKKGDNFLVVPELLTRTKSFVEFVRNVVMYDDWFPASMFEPITKEHFEKLYMEVNKKTPPKIYDMQKKEWRLGVGRESDKD